MIRHILGSQCTATMNDAEAPATPRTYDEWLALSDA
jgi:hypothetical protein